MKLILVAALLLSFANDPAAILSLDDDHSIGLSTEHGVDHLVFFHRPVNFQTVPGTYLAFPDGEEHHEVHLSSSTGLIQKKPQSYSFPMLISPATDHIYFLKPFSTENASTFERDIGESQLPFQVLRI